MPGRSTRKGRKMGKTLENPSGSSLGEDIVSERKKTAVFILPSIQNMIGNIL